MAAKIERLAFALAAESDASAVYDLVYKHPDPFLKAATLADVERWVATGSLWIVREATGAVVGACNIKIPETTPDKSPEPAEFGGIFLHPGYRKHGVADALAAL